MVERSEREPTLEEIVVALRETRRGAGRGPSFTVVGGSPSGNRASSAAQHAGADCAAREHGESDAQNETAGSTDISDLRDGEIERLLTENARLNERVVFLLKVLEGEQARSAEVATVACRDRVRSRRDLRRGEHGPGGGAPPCPSCPAAPAPEGAHPPAGGPRGPAVMRRRARPSCRPGRRRPSDAGWIVDLDAARS